MTNSVDPEQTGAVCSGSTLFASILNLSVMLGNYLQQTTSADDIFRCIFFLGALRVNTVNISVIKGIIKPWSAPSLQPSPSYIEELSPRTSPLARRHTIHVKEPMASQLPGHHHVITNQLSVPVKTIISHEEPSREELEEMESDDVFDYSDGSHDSSSDHFLDVSRKHRQSYPDVRFPGHAHESKLCERKFVCIHPYEPSHPAGLWLDYGDVVQG